MMPEPSRVFEMFGPIILFLSVYVATFLTLAYGEATVGLPYPQWAALLAAIAATAFTVRVAEGGRWRVGLLVAPKIAAIDLLLGVAFASALVLVGDALVLSSSDLRHVRGAGLSGFELVA